MFGIGMPEMLVLLAVALIVFGPKKLPELAKSLGRALGEFKRATSDLKDSIETQTGTDEIRRSLDEVKEDIQSQIDSAGSIPNPSEPPSKQKAETPSQEPLDQVKAAFDEMNNDEGESESQKDPSADQDPTPQDTTKP
jgi:sec-independent protein translocase protein TatB